MSRNAQNDHLTRLEQTSIHVFREAFANFRSVCIVLRKIQLLIFVLQ